MADLSEQKVDVQVLNDLYPPTNTGFHNSDYCTFDILREKNKSVIVSLNICSFNSKRNQIINLIETNPNIKIFCLQEIWNMKQEYIEGFDIYTNIRKSRDGGGVGILISNGIKNKQLDSLTISKNHLESIGISYRLNGKEKIILSIYRPPLLPKSDIDKFYVEFQILINYIKKNHTNSEIEIAGDFNLNLLTSNIKNKFFNFASTNNLFVGINRPTRYDKKHKTVSCIDNILSTEPIEHNYHIINIDISDHWPTIKCIETEPQEQNQDLNSFRRYTDVEKMNFQSMLLNYDWSQLTNTTITLVKWEIFFNAIDQCFIQSFPFSKSKIKKKKSNVPWLQTPLIKSFIHKEKCLYRRRIKSNLQEDIENHQEYKAWLKKTLRNERIQYYKKFFRENSKNSKTIWAEINKLTNKKPKLKLECNELKKENGQITTNPTEIVTIFNSFFTSIGKSLSDKITQNQNEQEAYFNNLTNAYSNVPQFKFKPLSIPEVIKLGKSIQPKKSAGPDGIPGVIAKICILTIPHILQNIINSSLSTGRIPERLKNADVIILHKKGEKSNPNNYRPISLLNSFSKIVEKTVSAQLSKHLNDNNILYKHQFGFRKSHSTIHALTHFLHKHEEFTGEKKKIAAIFIDLCKAFDTCNHNIILKKINILGIKDNELSWFKNYLKDRKQRVKINNTYSEFQKINIGVPQGSILGPLLFSIYINDFPEITDLLAVLFADDTTIIIEHEDNNQLKNISDRKLKVAAQWFKHNELTLNAAKTRVIHFNNKNPPELSIDNTKITSIHSKNSIEPTFKFLGFNINENLNMDDHIKIVIKKLLSSNYALKSLKKTIEPREKRLIYYSLFQSNLEYGICIYGNNKRATKPIISLQKNAVCNIHGSKKVHSEPLFKKYRILKFEDLLYVNKLSFAHSVVYNYAPEIIKMDIKKVNPNIHHDLRRNPLNLECNAAYPNSLTKFLIPNSWNNLEESYKTIQKPSLFKKAIKKKILASYQSNINCSNINCYLCAS